jgi:DNA-binding response OmpR family regulator
MEVPVLEVTVVAPSPEVVETRLVDSLRREGIVITEEWSEAWPVVATASMYVWFPGRVDERALERVAAWLESQAVRPAMLAIAGGEEVEALLGAGLDDAVPRTISERELVARIRALHRRLTRRPREGQLRFGALTIDTVERAAWMDGAIVSITPIEQAVLVTLIRARGRALSRLALLEAAWSDGDFEISERAVDNVILRLRRKLPRPEVIETVRGVGFRLADGGRELHP